MEPARLVAFLGGLHDQLGAHGEIAELERVRRHQIAEIVLTNLAPERLDAMRRARQALVRADDADVVPHQAADLIPHVRDQNRLVRRHGAADPPIRNRRKFLERLWVGTESSCGKSRTDKRLHQRIGRQAVRAVKTGTRALADSREPLDRRNAVRRRLDAATCVVRRGDDRNQILRHVDPELHALVVDVREARHQVRAALLPDVEEHAVVARPLHLGVDGPRHDVARRQTSARIVLLHELLAVLVDKDSSFATHRLGNEEALCLRMVKARRMELNELHVLDLRPRTPCKRDAVPRRRVGIACVEIDLAATARRQNRVRRPNRVNLTRPLVEHIRPDAPVLPFHADALRHDEVDDDRFLSDVDAFRPAHPTNHRRLALLTGDVARVEDTPCAVSALTREVPRATLLLRELDAAVDEILNALRRMLADLMDDFRLPEPRARDHRITRMLVESVRRIHHTADSALRKIRIAVLKPSLRRDDDLAVGGEVQRTHEPGHAGPHHEVIAVNDFHCVDIIP